MIRVAPVLVSFPHSVNYFHKRIRTLKSVEDAQVGIADPKEK